MMSEPAQKCKNLANFKQKYTLELFIALEMVYYCCFSLGGNLDFLNFLQKSIITSTTVLGGVWNRKLPSQILGGGHFIECKYDTKVLQKSHLSILL